MRLRILKPIALVSDSSKLCDVGQVLSMTVKIGMGREYMGHRTVGESSGV